MWFEECIGLFGIFFHVMNTSDNWLTLKEQTANTFRICLGFVSEFGLLKKF